jgi:hypothetical protein
VWHGAAEVLQCRSDQMGGDAADAAYPQRLGIRSLLRARGRHGMLHLLQRGPRMLQHDLTEGGRHRSRAAGGIAGPQEQGCLHRQLQRADRLADGGLRHVKGVRGSGEPAALTHGDEHRELPQADISRADRHGQERELDS